MKKQTKVIRLVSLILVAFALLSFTSCNDKKVKAANEPGETTTAAVDKLETTVDKLAHSTDCLEDNIPDIFFEHNAKTYKGQTYYRKWYKQSMVSGVNLNNKYDGTTLTFFCYFNDGQIKAEMNDVLKWAKEYINSQNLGIKVNFRSDGSYQTNKGYNNIVDFSVAGEDGGDWDVLEDAWAFCHSHINGTLNVGGKTFSGLAISETDIVFKAIMTQQNTKRYEYILLHELGHAFGLKHPDGSCIGKGNDYFKDETVMAAHNAAGNITVVDDHAAYYTIDAAALRLLYN